MDQKSEARCIPPSGIEERCPSWLKERDWKSRVLPKVVPGVRIPLSPPYIPLAINIGQELKIYISSCHTKSLPENGDPGYLKRS